MKVYYNPHNATGKGKAKEKEKNNGGRLPQLLVDNNCEIHDVQRCPWPGKLLRVTGCSLVWFGIVWRHDSMMLHGTVWYGMVWFGGIIVWCCMVWWYGDKLVAL